MRVSRILGHVLESQPRGGAVALQLRRLRLQQAGERLVGRAPRGLQHGALGGPHVAGRDRDQPLADGVRGRARRLRRRQPRANAAAREGARRTTRSSPIATRTQRDEADRRGGEVDRIDGVADGERHLAGGGLQPMQAERDGEEDGDEDEELEHASS